jgi:hypothetical protein
MAITDFFNTAVCAELAAFITALVVFAGRRYGYWSLFIAYLFITIAVEAAGFYTKTVLRAPNYPYYNFLMIVQVLFFSYLFFRFHPPKSVRILLLLMLGFFMIFFIGEGIGKSFAAYNKTSRQLLSGYTVLFCCIFYFSLIREETVRSPLGYAPFWIVTGLFFYYFGTIALFAFYDRVSQIKLAGTISFYNLVTGCLSCILYGSWIIGFICRKKQAPSSMP